MLNKSIAYKLSIYISLAVISVFMAFILLFYIYNQNLLNKTIEDQAKGLSSRITGKVRNYVVTTNEIASNISEQIFFYEKADKTGLFIASILKKYQFINSIHISLTEPFKIRHHFYKNSLLDSKENQIEGFDNYLCEAEKEIFEKSFINNLPAWTEPFKCPLKNEIVAARFSPVLLKEANDNSKVIGKIIIELSLVDLNDTINNIKIGKKGYAFIIDRNGNYITHPKKEWILNRNVKNFTEKVFNDKKTNSNMVLNSRKPVSMIIFSEYLNNEKCWLYYSPIDENGWSLVFIIPYNELFAPLYKATLRMLFVSVLGILIIFMIVTYITNKLLKPLKDATNELKTFSNTQGNNHLKTFDEARQVADSLEFFKSWYEKYNIEQNHELLKKKRHLQDMHQASEIQMSILNTSFPAFPNNKEFELCTVYKPAHIVSGDLYDYFFIDDENLLITIGDVSGKGIPAAIFMGISQTIIKNNSIYKKAKTIVNKANKDLCTNNQHQFYLTLFLGILNIKTGKFNFCNAAHTNAFIKQKNGEILDLHKAHGLPLGIYPDKSYIDSETTIQKGDYLVLFTDGFTEQINNRNQRFGIDNLKVALGKNSGLSPKEIIDNFVNTIEKYREDQTQTDDMSMIILKLSE